MSRFLSVSLACLALVPLTLQSQEKLPTQPVQVKIQDDKVKVVAIEPGGTVDPVKRVNYQGQPNLGVNINVEGKQMHLGFIYTIFHIDGRVQQPGRVEMNKGPLPKGPGGKDRDGYMHVVANDKIRITQTVEVVATKNAPGKPRRRDAVMVRYSIENKDTESHKVGMRVGMDMFLVDNDGALFAAPNHPNKILDGIELKDKGVPEYVQVLQRPNLKDPGFVAHFTYNLGTGLERPTRVVLTGLAANSPDGWNLVAQQANGDSAMSMYWDIKEIKAGTKRECAYAYGQGLAPSLENEGNVRVDLAGSFEPGKLFNIVAHVVDPAPGQSLKLELPEGLELKEGREIQPVPQGNDDGESLVLWKASVVKLGEYRLNVHSSNGISRTKIVTISKN